MAKSYTISVEKIIWIDIVIYALSLKLFFIHLASIILAIESFIIEIAN